MIVLASASPRRKELLALITEEFAVEVSGADESCAITDPRELVRHLAHKKAAEVFSRRPGDIVIGADTVVEAPDGEIFGKPKDEGDARRMLRALAGSAHWVHTGVCVLQGGGSLADVCSTKVFFNPMTEEELSRYLEMEDVLDKAGAYAIQGPAAKHIARIEGDFFNVVGLPLSMLYGMLKKSIGTGTKLF